MREQVQHNKNSKKLAIKEFQAAVKCGPAAMAMDTTGNMPLSRSSSRSSAFEWFGDMTLGGKCGDWNDWNREMELLSNVRYFSKLT